MVYAGGKTPAETVACLAGLLDGGAPLAWATRVDDVTAAAVRERWPDAVVDGWRGARSWARCPPPVGQVLVLTAGTSDGPVAAEVAATLAASGVGGRRVVDVGVAGVHRVLAVAPDIAAADVVVVVAGMDGALPSVVAGLADRPWSRCRRRWATAPRSRGWPPLLTMLTACAPGVSWSTSTTASAPVWPPRGSRAPCTACAASGGGP